MCPDRRSHRRSAVNVTCSATSHPRTGLNLDAPRYRDAVRRLQPASLEALVDAAANPRANRRAAGEGTALASSMRSCRSRTRGMRDGHHLSRQQALVRRHRRRRFPRQFCGAASPRGAAPLEALGPIRPKWLVVRLDDIIVHGPNGHEVRFPLPRTKVIRGVARLRPRLCTCEAAGRGCHHPDGKRFDRSRGDDTSKSSRCSSCAGTIRDRRDGIGLRCASRRCDPAALPRRVDAFRQYFTTPVSLRPTIVVGFEPRYCLAMCGHSPSATGAPTSASVSPVKPAPARAV